MSHLPPAGPVTSSGRPPRFLASDANEDAALAASARRKAYRHVVLPLFLTSTVAYLDRVNISYAALTMNADLGFDPRVFGVGAGIFFAGYFLFGSPGRWSRNATAPGFGWRGSWSAGASSPA